MSAPRPLDDANPQASEHCRVGIRMRDSEFWRWHVCRSATEVSKSAGDESRGAHVTNFLPQFEQVTFTSEGAAANRRGCWQCGQRAEQMEGVLATSRFRPAGPAGGTYLDTGKASAAGPWLLMLMVR